MISTRTTMRWLTAAAFVTSPFVSAQSSSISNGTVEVEPCAQLGTAVANNATRLDATIALACLQSVPVDIEGDIAEIEGLKLLVKFQSDLAYLKHPPPGWLYPGVDVLGSLDQIQDDVQSGYYANDFDVQNDLYNLVVSTYDFHFNVIPDLVTAFNWFRDGALISISPDGSSLPSIYDLVDFRTLSANSSGYKPSPVVKINGDDVEEWLNDYATYNPWDHDPDANYNNIFVNIPVGIKGKGPTQSGYGSYQYSSTYQGNKTVLAFANGTSKNVAHYATSSCSDFSQVIDGPSFYQHCVAGASSPPDGTSKRSPTKRQEDPSQATTQNAYTAVPTQTAAPAPAGYPYPFIITSDVGLAGYFPASLPDTVVMALPDFGPKNNYEFQNAVRSILATANAAGKSKLIIDLRGNGGGTVMDGYDLFKQLFPDVEPYGGTNLAAFDVTNGMGEVATAQVANGNSTDAELGALSDYDVTQDLTVVLQDFDSWSDFYGPVLRNGGSFTKVKRFNLSDPYSLGNPIYGYINDTRPQPQTFDPDDIVMLTDGFCGSTCAVFAELMKSQADTHSIAVGGRKQYGPMQAVGGTKGANVQDFTKLAAFVDVAYARATPDQQSLFEDWPELQPAVQQALTRLGGSGRVNFENNIRVGDGSATPLQFVYEAADCRFFYTAPMFADQSLVWKRTYDLRWGNGTCVAGSTGQPSSVSGNATTYIQAYPPAGANNTFGANSIFSFPGAYNSSSAKASSATTKSTPAATASTGKPSASSVKATASTTGSASSSRPSATATQSVQPYTGSATSSTSIGALTMLLAVIAGVAGF